MMAVEDIGLGVHTSAIGIAESCKMNMPTIATRPNSEFALNANETQEEEDEMFISKTKSRKKVIVSDDEEDDESNINKKDYKLNSDEESDNEFGQNKNNVISSRRRLLQLDDSDNEDAAENNPAILISVSATRMDLKENLGIEDQIKVPPIYKYKSDIFDTETSDDELCHRSSLSPRSTHVNSEDDNSKECSSEKKLKKSFKKKSKASTLMEKKKDKLEIFSESQKRIRESDICLPYHKPKQRSLSEFLNRKKSVYATSCNMRRSLKMSMKDENLLREIEERKNDVVTFYKSDSEDDDVGLDYRQKEVEEQKDVEEKDVEEEKELIDFEESVDKNNGREFIPMEANSFRGREMCPERKEISFDLDNACSNASLRSDDENVLQTFEKKASQEALIHSVELTCGTENDTPLNTAINVNKVINNIPLTDDASNNKDCDTTSDILGCLETSVVREIFSNLDDDTENFRLHIDTDDIEEANLAQQSNINLSLELKKAMNNCSSSNTSSNDNLNGENNSFTPKMDSFASRYPKLDLSKISTITPKIGSDCDGSFIDLDDEESDFKTPKLVEGASRLIDRFVHHSNTKRKPSDAQTVSLNIVSKEKDSSGEIKLVSSGLLVDIHSEGAVEDNYKDPVPGARLVLLKSSLKAQLLQQREKERQRRENEKKFIDSEEIIQDYNDGLPDEEGELTDGSETEYETESEPEENDVVIKEKTRKKNKFLDEEAQESDDEDDGEDDASNNELEETGNQGETSRGGPNEDSNNSCYPSTTTKKVSRKKIDDADDYSNIDVTYENDDSEGEENLKLRWSESINLDGNTSQAHPTFSRASTEDLFSSEMGQNFGKKGSMDSSFELVGSLIPGHQPGGSKEPKKNDSFLEDDTCALTMFSRLDNLRKHSSSDDSELQKPSFNLLLTPLKGSQFASDNRSPVKASLFKNLPHLDGMGSQQSQELLGLCSGDFTTQNAEETGRNKVSSLCQDDVSAPTQDFQNLVGLCSGQFTSQISSSDDVTLKKVGDLCDDDELPPTQDINDLVGLCSGQFTTQKDRFSSLGFSNSQCESFERNTLNDHLEKTSTLNNGRELTDGSSSPTGSQIDESSLPQKNSESERILSKKPQIELYSSDEEGILQRQNKKHKKKRKRIMAMSDDESAATDNSIGSITDDDVEYDEDELPIAKDKFSGFKDGVKGGIRSDFLDKEAELSGSEEGSEDEDEPDEDNDIMEQEAGDLDRFDEEELRNEIGKAHLKSVIDSDKRELKLLQELYLEDGDLHGQGRQRKFRWQHLNSTEDDEDRKSDDEVIENEEVLEEEMEWRKQRFEREKFIRDQKGQKNVSSPEKVVDKAVVSALIPSRKVVKTSSCKPTPLLSSKSFPLQNTPLPIHDLLSSSKRGSFLRRDASTLKKIAEFTKENQTIGGAKQGGNFVFHSLTAEEIEKKTTEVEKRKSNLEKPQPKKCRLERSFFSMDAGSQNLSIFKHL